MAKTAEREVCNREIRKTREKGIRKTASFRVFSLFRGSKPISRAQGGDAAGVEAAFEIGDDGAEFLGRFKGMEQGTCGGEDGGHLAEIIRIVSAQIDDATRGEGLAGDFGKAGIDEAIFAMFAFGPWVGEIDMDGASGIARQQVFQKIGGFDAHSAEIGEGGAAGLAVELAEAAKQAFDAQKIALVMQFGVIDKERTIAAAQFDFERLGLRKHFRQIQSFQDGSDGVNQGIRRLGQGSCDHFK